MTWIIVLIVLTLAYGFLNGQHGSASVVAATISSRSISPRLAFWLTALGMGLGPFLLGSAVASTIGSGLVHPDEVDPTVAIAALIGAVAWSSFTLWLKIPVSISQALFGGVLGAVWAGFGGDALDPTGLLKTLAGLFLSPILGLFCAYVVVQFNYLLSSSATPRVNFWFRYGQVLVSLLLAVTLGSNDAQKLVGIIMLGLLSAGLLDQFTIPQWVLAVSVAPIFLGSLIGGWRLVHTVGGRFYKIRPIHGFSAQAGSAVVMLGAALFGWPVSGSQVITSAIVGAGSADRLQKVRWGVAQSIMLGWLLTIPLSAAISALAYHVLKGLKL